MGKFLIDNDHCLACIQEKPFWLFWTRWYYSVGFYRFMTLRPYRRVTGRCRTEFEARAKVTLIYAENGAA